MKRMRTGSQGGPRKRVRYNYEQRPRSVRTKAYSEMKYYDTEMNGDGINSTVLGWSNSNEMSQPGLSTLSAPTLGNDINNRVGKRIHVKRISLRGHISVPANTLGSTVPVEYPCIRMVLFVNQQVNGTQTNCAELFTSASLAGSAAIHAFQNVAFLGKYRILRDRYIRLIDPNLVGSTGGGNIEWSGYQIPFKIKYTFRKPLPITFNNGTSNQVSSLSTNSIQLAVAASNGVNQPLLHYKCRIAFTDG